LFAFGRFPDPRRLMSYLGLTPRENSSGEKVKKGPITKAGNKRIRRLLIQAGWHQRHMLVTSKDLAKRRKGQPEWVVKIAKSAQKRLHKRYWHLLHNGKMPVKAVTAVAREMVGFIWDVLWRFVELGEHKEMKA
jgi:transposase